MTDFPATDWSRYDVPTIAGMLLGDDDGESWRTVNAWLAVYETISVHQSQLARAQAELTEAWPPDHSAAASAFQEMVSGLGASLSETADAAYGNARAVSNSLDAVATARDVVGSLHQQWQQHAAVEDPAGTAWARDLNSQAQQIMRITDQAVFDNTQRLVVIPTMAQLGAIASNPVSSVPKPNSPKQTSGISSTVYSGPSIVAASGTQSSSTALAGSSPRLLPTSTNGISVPATTAVAALGAVGVTGVVRPRASKAASTVSGSELHPNTRSDVGSSNTTEPQSATSNVNAQGRTRSTALTDGESSAQEHGGLLASQPNMIANRATNGRGKRRRGMPSPAPEQRFVVPPLIVPKPIEPVVHDPGPGVIGIDR